MTYRCVAKGGKSFRNTEFFVFDGDKVRRIDVYFGATYENGAFVRQAKAGIRGMRLHSMCGASCASGRCRHRRATHGPDFCGPIIRDARSRLSRRAE